MKKKFGIMGIALVVALMASLCFGSVALADDPTTVTVDWDDGLGGWGTGSVGATVTAGDDATTTFLTTGGGIMGSFTATDFNNPYYFVDSFTTSFSADVANGFATISTERTDFASGWAENGPPYMYGFAGEYSYNYVSASGGTAHLSVDSLSSYASMYTHSGSLDANATAYRIESWFGEDGDPSNLIDNWAGLIAFGGGTADIDMGHSSASYHGDGTVTFGWGCGCYTNADAAFTGFGTFQVDAVGSNSITVPGDGAWVIPGSGTYGSCSYTTIATFTGSFNVPNYSVAVR